MRALFTLTPAEAKRLIAKAVVKLPQVQEAYKNGRLAVVGGTTNAFVVEELLGIKLKKENYTAGVITDGRPCVSDLPQMIKPYLFEHGKRVDTTIGEFVKRFTARDALIKGQMPLIRRVMQVFWWVLGGGHHWGCLAFVDSRRCRFNSACGSGKAGAVYSHRYRH